MTQSKLPCADSSIAQESQHAKPRRAGSAAESDQGKSLDTRIGLLIVLTTAAIFYGGVVVIIKIFI